MGKFFSTEFYKNKKLPCWLSTCRSTHTLRKNIFFICRVWMCLSGFKIILPVNFSCLWRNKNKSIKTIKTRNSKLIRNYNIKINLSFNQLNILASSSVLLGLITEHYQTTDLKKITFLSDFIIYVATFHLGPSL